MLEFCYNSDDVRYCGEFNFPKKEGTYYVHIYKKKDFSDNSYIGCIYYSYNKNINRIIVDDDIVYKGELMLIKNNEFVINGKCDKLVIDDECGSTYTGEIKNQKMNGYGIFQNNVVKYEGCYKDGKKHGLIIENEKRYCYYQDDVLKYYCDTEKVQEGIMQNVFFEQVGDVYKKIIDKNRIEQLYKLFQEKKQEFHKLKANFQKKEEEENTTIMSRQNCVISCDESNGKLTILENNDKNNNKNYNEQKKLYTLYLNSQFKEQKINNQTEKTPEGKYEIYFFNGNEKRIYIKGERSKDVIKGTKYYMDGLKEYEGEFNEDYKENGIGMYYNNNKKTYKYGLWENGNFKTGIMKKAENSSIIEIGDFKENYLFNGIRIINNEQKKCYEVEYWVEGVLQKNKTEQGKNYNDIEDINFDILEAYYKKYLEDYQKTNDNYITKNNFIIKYDIIRKFQEEDRKAKRNIINEETENCLRFFNEDYMKYCCCVFG